jgi:hypothetical protein
LNRQGLRNGPGTLESKEIEFVRNRAKKNKRYALEMNLHGFSVNICKAGSKIDVSRRVQGKCISVAPLQERHAKGIAEPITGLAHPHSESLNRWWRRSYVRLWNHATAPTGDAPFTGRDAAIATVTRNGERHLAEHAMTDRMKFGRCKCPAKFAGFSFGWEGNGAVTGGTTRNGGNPCAAHWTAMNGPRLQCSAHNAISRHQGEIKV